MAEVRKDGGGRRLARWWPIGLALLGIAGLVWSGLRVAQRAGAPADDDPFEEVAPVPEADLAPGEHFEQVRAHETDVYQEFRGVVEAEGQMPVRGPQGVRVPVLKIHREVGEFVSKGDLLISLDRQTLESQIERAREQGDEAAVARGQEWLGQLEIRAPVDGIVLELTTEEGQVPFDVGMPLVTLTDRSAFRFRVQVPSALLGTVLHKGARAPVRLDHDLGTAVGTVTDYGDPVGQDAVVLLGLDAHEGIEPGISGMLRVPVSKQAVSLVPKSAVKVREGVHFVRKYEPEDREILDQSLKVTGEQGEDLVVEYGVVPGEHIVVPGPARD